MLYRLFIFFAVLITTDTVLASPADKDGWLPFTSRSGVVTIDVEFEGQTRKAIIDSGSEINAINAVYVDLNKDKLSFGDKIRLQGVFGEETKALVNAVPVQMFGQRFELDALAPAQLGDAILLLGLPFLQNFIVQFDYPHQKMRFLPHSLLDMKKLANVELKKNRNRNLPAIKVETKDGKSFWLTLDTGNSGGLVVSRQFAKDRGWLDNKGLLKHSALGAVHSGNVESFNISYLKVGPFEMENVLVTVPDEGVVMNVKDSYRTSSRSAVSGAATKGLLGYDVLKHFVVTLDCKNWRAHIAVP